MSKFINLCSSLNEQCEIKRTWALAMVFSMSSFVVMTLRNLDFIAQEVTCKILRNLGRQKDVGK
jgi:hypothetical protein